MNELKRKIKVDIILENEYGYSTIWIDQFLVILDPKCLLMLDLNRMQQFFDHYLMGAPKPVWMVRGVPAIEKGINQGYELSQ